MFEGCWAFWVGVWVQGLGFSIKCDSYPPTAPEKSISLTLIRFKGLWGLGLRVSDSLMKHWAPWQSGIRKGNESGSTLPAQSSMFGLPGA